MYRSRQVDGVFNRLTVADNQFLGQEFLAPMLQGGSIQVRPSGIPSRLRVEPPDFEGWGIFRSISSTAAQLVCRANLAERQRYLSMLPSVRLILCARQGRSWQAIPASRGDNRLLIEKTIPVYLTEAARPFEVIAARFDGLRCWYDRLDPRRDPGTAAYLRLMLEDMLEPEQLSRPGLTAEECEAYSRSYSTLFLAQTKCGHPAEAWLRNSVVQKDDSAIRVAGLCLNGEDEQFDLGSLVEQRHEARGSGSSCPRVDASHSR
jgi:hypothetical protein